MSTFPDDYDSDVEIQRIDQNVSEISGDVINSIRDAIFALQRVIGLSPQGNKASFKDRMNVSIDSNGNIKRNALEGIGLITLPVTNNHIGFTAGIEESKLALDYQTTYLKNLIDSVRIDVNGITSGVSSSTSLLNSHVLGQGNYHDGYHIKINLGTQYGIAGMEATTVGDALNEFGALLLSGKTNMIPHIDTGLPNSVKHVASKISVDASDFYVIDRTVDDVQEALESFDLQSRTFGVDHVDGFHSNGILKEIDSGTTYNEEKILLDATVGASYNVSESVITIPGVTSFTSLGVRVGDIIVIYSPNDTILDSGTFQIRAIGPLTDSETLGDLPTMSANQVAIFHTFQETKTSIEGVYVKIHKPSSVSSRYAPLACSVRNNETLVDTISIMNPEAANVVSVGFNGSIIGTDGYEIGVKVGIGGGKYREIVIPGLHRERLGTNRADPVDAESVAERINAFVSDPDLEHNFPITAYKVGNEFAVAHNWVGTDYTLEISDGYTGNFALGFDAYGADIVGETIVGNTNATYSVNGILLSTLKTDFSGYASITSESSSFMLYDSSDNLVNPLAYGIGPGSVMHISEHPTEDTNGSYTIYTANSTTVTLFNPEVIDAPDSPTRFSVKFTSSNVRLTQLESTEVEMGLAQVFVDSNGQTFVHQRLIYGTNIGPAFEIANLSDTFPVGSKTVYVGFSGDFIDFNVIDDTIAGPTVRVHEDFKGSFNLYHSNGLDYLKINIIDGSISGGVETITVNSPIPEDQGLLLCTAHFNGTLSVTNLMDERLFGNMSANQVRDDFIEIFSQKPISDLRSNGVARGLDLMDLIYSDSVTNMQAVPLRGGIAYVNGVRLAVETQKVIIQSFDESGNKISGDRIIGINDFGSIQVVSDSLGEILTDGYNSSLAYGKILPLYRVTMNQGLIGDIVDIRRFINNVDEKLDMIVDESNNIVGSFRSIEGALLYAEMYPGNERLTIRIINSVTPTNHLIVPEGVSIIGGAPYGGNGKHRIVNNSNRTRDFITLMGDNILENIEVVSSTTGLQGSLVAVSGDNVSIEKCSFGFSGVISSNSGDIGVKINIASNVRIVNNKIDNVYSGIVSEFGCDNLFIEHNQITGVSGIGLGCGIRIGSTTRSVTNMFISDNIIEFDTVANTDLRGIYIDTNQSIDTVRIFGNKITCGLDVNDENHVSNGIRITNTSGTGNKISQLFMRNNYLENVKLHHTFVYAVYLSFVEQVVFSDNNIINAGVYDENYSEIAYLWVDDNVDSIEITNNYFSDGESRLGIYIKDTSTITSILDNTLKNIGETSADYIYGSAHRAKVTGNKLIGPGNYGIRWKGQYSKISGNYLSSDGADYAFKTAIVIQASYVDVENNSIVDMTDNESIGIMIYASSNDGAKINGNTIIGDYMYKLIDLKGSYHAITGNRFRNDTESTSGESKTYFIYFAANCDSISIIGNIFEGQNDSGAIGTAYIYSASHVSNISITNNHMCAAEYTTTLTSAPIRLIYSTVSGCFVAGNQLPPKASYPSADNQIGQSPSYGVYNDNTIGISKGMLDTRGVHACEGVTSYDSSGAADYSEYPHWVFNDSGSYWEVNSVTTSDSRYLYFPISGIPNGAILESVEVQGKNESQAGDTFTAQIIKRSVKSILSSDLRVTAISETKDLSTASAVFGNSTNVGLVDKDTGGIDNIEEIINYEESNYYVQIIHQKASPTSPDDIRIYGMTITFRY